MRAPEESSSGWKLLFPVTVMQCVTSGTMPGVDVLPPESPWWQLSHRQGRHRLISEIHLCASDPGWACALADIRRQMDSTNSSGSVIRRDSHT